MKFEMPMRHPNRDVGEAVEMESGSWEKGQGYGCTCGNHTIGVL